MKIIKIRGSHGADVRIIDSLYKHGAPNGANTITGDELYGAPMNQETNEKLVRQLKRL